MVNHVPYWADTVNYATINEAANILIWRVNCELMWITDSVLIWDMKDDGQRGEAEDKDS